MGRYFRKINKSIFLFCIVLLSLSTITTAKAEQNIDYPENGAVFSSTPSHISIILPVGAVFSHESVKVIASNNKLVPIRNIEKSNNRVVIKTSALPPGRVNLYWEFLQYNKIIKNERTFVIEVDWSISTAGNVIDKNTLERKASTNIFPLGILLVLIGGISILAFAVKSKNKSKVIVLILLIALGTSSLSFSKEAALASDKTLESSATNIIIENPDECVENNFNLGLQNCLRLWSLQAANINPDQAVEKMSSYIKKYKGSNYEICDTLVEYTYEAITLTNGVGRALELVGSKDCGYEGPDTRGIFKSAASFVGNNSEIAELNRINDQCNTVIKPVVGDETALLCRFPVPWFLLSLTNADLLKSLQMCKEQSIFGPVNKCEFWIFGVFFSKYVASYQDFEKESSEERFTTPYKSGREALICEYFSGSTKKLCYAQAAQTYGYSMEMVSSYQKQCYELSAESKKECFEGVGYPLGNLMQLSFKDSIKPCLEQPKSEQRGCIVWAITGRSSHHGDSIEEMVSLIPDKFKENIEKDINSYGKNI